MALDMNLFKKAQEDKPKFQRYTWTPREGQNIIRVLPICSADLTRDYGQFDIPVQTHHNVGPNAKTFNCPRSNNFRTSCPACAAASQLWKSDNPADKEMGKKLFSRKLHLLNIIDLTTPEETKKGVQVYAAPEGSPAHPGVYLNIVGLLGVVGLGDIFDLDRGRNIIITRNGTGVQTSYTVMADYSGPSSVRQFLLPGFENVLDTKWQEWFTRIPTDEEIEKIMMGVPEAPAAHAPVQQPLPQAQPTYAAAPAPQYQKPAMQAPAPMQYQQPAQPYQQPAPQMQPQAYAQPAPMQYAQPAPQAAAPQMQPTQVVNHANGSEAVYGGQPANPKPTCFGEQYAATSQRCQPCPFVQDCATQFMGM